MAIASSPTFQIHDFAADDSGAVTVDWVVLTAALVGLGLATLGVVSSGVESQSEDVARTMTGPGLITTFFGSGVSNGSFETPTSGYATSWGYSATELDGWTSVTGANLELVNAGHNGFAAADGDYYLDLEGNAGSNIGISQTLDKAKDGINYEISFAARDTVGNNAAEIYWGGELVDTFNGGTSDWESFSYSVTGGAGDGSNTLEIREVGTSADARGTYIDALVLQ